MVKTKSFQSDTFERLSGVHHPKYKFRSERKMLIKLCRKKLRVIDDPDIILCKSVLINNTLKYCQKALPEKCREENRVTMADLEAVFEDSEEETETDKPKESKDKTVLGLSMPIIG